MAQIIKPDHKAFADYYQRLKQARAGKDTQHEGNIRHAFANLLEDTARATNWKLVQEHTTRVKGRSIRYDGVLRDDFLPRGYWEAKDESDDLETEIRRKREKGYSFKNIIFEDTQNAVLFQEGLEVVWTPVDDQEGLADLLSRFYGFEIKPFADFDAAIEHFQSEIGHIASELNHKIKQAHKDNRDFQQAYAAFMELCRTALNPNIRQDAVDEMLIQHLLTERLIRKVFNVENFVSRNVIASEIEKVVNALTSRYFNRQEFLGALDRYYRIIERAADELAEDYKEKQHFINIVYEKFFQGYSVDIADTHGIVYTPQEIVDFMCAAVEEVLADEFGAYLGHPDVKVIDPATGTGNFIVNLLNRVDRRHLETFYRDCLFANEVMLLPYYVASLNIEHEYYERAGHYESFEGIAFVDTLDLAERTGGQQAFAFITEKNSERVEKQRQAKINVIIGNPPYNVGQLNENDNNKNRAYEIIDARVRDTYARDSNATLKAQLYDAYVKFFRWATDRLGDRDGIVCMVTNNSFVDQIAFDGMRKHLLQDFSQVFHLDLHGNVRQNPKLSGTTHNVFGIQVGVGITVAVRSSKHSESELFYHRVPEFWTRAEKVAWLAHHVELQGRKNSLNTIEWEELQPDDRGNWILSEFNTEYNSGLPIGDKLSKRKSRDNAQTIFHLYSLGVNTSRDAWVFNFSNSDLVQTMETLTKNYNYELFRWLQSGRQSELEEFINTDSQFMKWTDRLKSHLTNGEELRFDPKQVRLATYRPYSKRFLYFDHVLNQRRYQFHHIFPTPSQESENCVICFSGLGHDVFYCLISNLICEYKFSNSANGGTQCFPFYTYDEDGSKRRENITGWALAQFRAFYEDESISKWDIFYYVYGLLHHPVYRARYADNLKRELPRIPFVPVTPSPSDVPSQREIRDPTTPSSFVGTSDGMSAGMEGVKTGGFWAFSRTGKMLADLHLNYEQVNPWPDLKWQTQEPVSFKVEKMRLRGKVTPPPTPYMATPPQGDGEGSLADADEVPLHEMGRDLGRGWSTYDSLKVNDTLTITNIPAEAFAYRLGNRSALEWVVDQYRVKEDKRSGIVSDPNAYGDERYIVDLVEKVITVSVETVRIVDELAGWAILAE